ncbi:MAG: hypothetical protein EPN91_09190 [Salinibacterium sp.]|nr:MAG: hypothetical protein EPN91_09190 [Salinibacterium sp.]
MNVPDLDILTAGELTQIRADIAAACADPQAGGHQVTYKQRTAATPNYSTGVVTETFNQIAINTIRTQAEEDIEEGIQVGDAMFLFAGKDMSLDPGASDAIDDTGVTYQVVKAEKDPSGTAWRIFARREGTK